MISSPDLLNREILSGSVPVSDELVNSFQGHWCTVVDAINDGGGHTEC